MSEQNYDHQMKKLRRDLAFTRGVCIITSILTLLLLCGGGYLFLRMQGILENVQPILEQAAEVDIENVNETLWQIRTMLDTVDLDYAVETMEQAVAAWTNWTSTRSTAQSRDLTRQSSPRHWGT